MSKTPTIALLTDFGTEDGYVGAMKGRILTECPKAVLVDISHSIRPYDIRQAAYSLNNSYPYFPEKTVFVVVVDPGVGTERLGIVVKTSQHFFVGPDNGVFSHVFHREGYQAFQIQMSALPQDVSSTFHGRDVFARVGAWLALGKPMDDYLKPIKEANSFFKSPQKIAEGQWQLEVLHIDHFGNLIFNLHQQDWQAMESPERFALRIKNRDFRQFSDTFGNVPAGEFLLLWDSSGYLQVSQNQGSAAQALNAQVRDSAKLTL